MIKIDIYGAHRLDSQQPPAVLLQQLDAEAANTRDRLQRNRIANARAIIADPQRRAAYDQMLADPSAEITESTLSQFSGRPVPSAGISGSQRTKLALGIVAASLVLALVVAVVIVATAGGDDEPANAASSSTGASGSHDGPEPDANGVLPNSVISTAKWRRPSEVPENKFHLTAAYDLPASISSIVAATSCKPTATSICGLSQARDQSITINISNPDGRHFVAINPDGSIRSNISSSDPIPVERFDLAGRAYDGYYRVTAADGISIPAAAAGTKPDMVYLSAYIVDAFNQRDLWVLAKGGTKLYRAEIRSAS